MVRPESPLLVRPRLDLDFYRWSWRFARNCSHEQARAGTEALVRLGLNTFELFDELRAAGVRFEMHQTGLLFLALHESELAAHETMLKDVQAAGYPEHFEVLDPAGVRELEPAASERVVGGIYVRSERHVRPESLTEGLARYLAAEGVTIEEHAEAVSLDSRRNGGGWRVSTPGDDLTADAVVVAAGVWSAGVLGKIGVRLPLEAGKGFSMTAENRGVSPRHALYFMEAKVGCSPFNGSVRVAGTLELAGIDVTMDRRRLAPLDRAASAYLADWDPVAPSTWAGLRAVASDGLPIIGAVPGHAGLFVATGHAHLGVSLAPATGANLAPLVLDGRMAPELQPFQLDRRL